MKKLLDWLSFSREETICNDLRTEKDKGLKIASFVSWGIMLVAQFIILFRFNGPQVSDSANYLLTAQKCFDAHSFYPMAENLSNAYISGNGIINLLVLIFHFTSNLKAMFVINILFVNLMLVSCVYIIKKIFPKTTVQYWFIILFSLFTTMWCDVVNIKTEIPFTALCFFAVSFLFSEKKFKSVFCGVVLALANWIRPLGIITIIAIVFIVIYRKEKLRHLVGVVASYACVLLLIGGITFSSCGSFVYQATTLGYNLIMSANDDADGSYYGEVFHEGNSAYIPPEKRETMNYKDFDKYYKDLSLEWIKEHPADYIKQFPNKMFYLYATETYANSTLYNNEVETGGKDYIMSVANKLTGNSDEKLLFADVLTCFTQAWYMLTMLLFAIGTVAMLKLKKWRGMLPFYIMMAGFTGVVLIIVGGARYHFPMLPIILMSAAVGAQFVFGKIGSRTKKKSK